MLVDLAIIGPGVLGSLVAEQYRSVNPSATIALVFRSHDAERRDRLEKEGFRVTTSEEAGKRNLKAKNVVFSAPPTGNSQYADDVRRAVQEIWEGSCGGGAAVFTSSGGVYAENESGTIDEKSEVLRTERSGKLLDAEQASLEAGGTVVRLGGLYRLESGAHNFWAKGGSFPSKPAGLINLVHYSDAASALLLSLQNPSKVARQCLLVADGTPMSRQAILDAALKHPHFREATVEVMFTGGEGVDGKVYNCSKVREVLGWKPAFASFENFIDLETKH